MAFIQALNEKALIGAIARLVKQGDLHIVSFTPPGIPDDTVLVSFRSSSPTAYAELAKAANS